MFRNVEINLKKWLSTSCWIYYGGYYQNFLFNDEFKLKSSKSMHNNFSKDFFEAVLDAEPDNFEALETLGHLYTKLGEYQKGLEVDIKLTKHFPDNHLVWYNLACSYSLLNQVDEALNALEKAVWLGYEDLDFMHRDTDLDNIRNHPKFKEIIKKQRD